MADILILMGSPRRNGSTSMLAEAYCSGLTAENRAEIIAVSEFHVAPCTGCNACYRQTDRMCVQDDDMQRIYQKLKQTEILIVATPLYFYGVSAQLKAMIDRLHTSGRSAFGIRKLGLMAVGGAVNPKMFNALIQQFELVREYFGLESAGILTVSGVRKPEDLQKTDALERAGRMAFALSSCDGKNGGRYL